MRLEVRRASRVLDLCVSLSGAWDTTEENRPKASEGRYPNTKRTTKISVGPQNAAAQGDTFARTTSSQPPQAGATRYAPNVIKMTPREKEGEDACTKMAETNKTVSGPSKVMM